MKKISNYYIQITGFIFVSCCLLQGCIYEDLSGCPSKIQIYFDYEGGADKLSGSDIHLFLYEDDILKKTEIIPFDLVKGGKPYPLLYSYTGELSVTAWIIADKDKQLYGIPPAEPGKRKGEKRIQLKTINSQSNKFSPIGFLHSGSALFASGNDSTLILLQPAVCRLSVTVYDQRPDAVHTTENIGGIEVYGTQNEMDINLNPCGKDAIVMADCLFNQQENCWRTGEIGLLPSSGKQTISIRVFLAGEVPFTVHTSYVSKPGDFIQLEVAYTDTRQIRLFINGWKMMDFTIEDI